MVDQIPDELLARYLAGEASPEESAGIERRTETDPVFARELDRLLAAYAGVGGTGSQTTDQAWHRLAARLEEPVRVLPFHRRPLFRMAAALALVAGATLLWRGAGPAGPGPIGPDTIRTAAGERRSVELADGSRIVMAPGSVLRIATGLASGSGERRVDLEGEAWFEVEHDASRPFRVHTADAVAEDLGTEFTVRAWPGAGRVQVAVVSGEVALWSTGSGDTTSVTLGPEDVGELIAGESPTVSRPGSLAGFVSWREGRLPVEDLRLDALVVEFSRWYGITLTLGDSSLAARRVTATFDLDRMEDALDVLRLSLGVEIERRDGAILLR